MADAITSAQLSIDEAKIYLVNGATLAGLLRLSNAVRKMEGKNGAVVTVSDGNIIVAIDPAQMSSQTLVAIGAALDPRVSSLVSAVNALIASIRGGTATLDCSVVPALITFRFNNLPNPIALP